MGTIHEASQENRIMSTVATPMSSPPGAPGWIPSPLYRMSVEEYEAMVASGFFPDRKRVHRIRGLLVEKMTQNPPHAIADDLCGQELARALPGWYIRSAKPIRLPEQSSAPEPDRCVVRGPARQYRNRHPEPSEIVLVVEVFDSSLADDREVGAEVYGPAGLPVYWIVNLVDRQIEVHTDPGPSGYTSRTVYQAGATVPIVIDGQEIGRIAVETLLP